MLAPLLALALAGAPFVSSPPPAAAPTSDVGTATTYTATAGSGGNGFKLTLGAYFCFDASCTVKANESGGAAVFNARIGAPSFSATVASGSSALLMLSGSTLCLDSDNACATLVKASSGDLRLTVGTGKRTYLGGNISNGRTYVDEADGTLNVIDGSLTMGGSSYAKNYFYSNAYQNGYAINVDGTDSAGNAIFTIHSLSTYTLLDMLQLKNNNTVVARFDTNGAVQINMNGGSEPTCDSTKRGLLFDVRGAGGVADHVDMCMKNAADAYAWVTIKTAP